MSGINLYQIEEALTELLSAREELTADLTAGTQTEETAAELVEVEKALTEYVAREIAKVDGIHGYLRYAKLTAVAARQEAAEYLEHARRLEASEGRLKALCVDIMQAMGKTKLEGTCCRVLAVQGNGGMAPLTVQEDVLPDCYCDYHLALPGDLWATLLALVPGTWRDRIKGHLKARVSSNVRIREALAMEENVPGAHLEERGFQLRVK